MAVVGGERKFLWTERWKGGYLLWDSLFQFYLLCSSSLSHSSQSAPFHLNPSKTRDKPYDTRSPCVWGLQDFRLAMFGENGTCRAEDLSTKSQWTPSPVPERLGTRPSFYKSLLPVGSIRDYKSSPPSSYLNTFFPGWGRSCERLPLIFEFLVWHRMFSSWVTFMEGGAGCCWVASCIWVIEFPLCLFAPPHSLSLIGSDSFVPSLCLCWCHWHQDRAMWFVDWQSKMKLFK